MHTFKGNLPPQHLTVKQLTKTIEQELQQKKLDPQLTEIQQIADTCSVFLCKKNICRY